jgi:hypothetical protein
MNDELADLWASAPNGLTAEAVQRLAAAALAQVSRARRRRRVVLGYIFVMVPLVTVGTGWQIARHATGWRETWPAGLMLAAQWITALLLLRIFRRGSAPAAERPIRAAIEALLDHTSARCRELQTLLGLFAIVAPLAAAAIVQLQANGKMRPHEAASAGTLFGAILLLGSGWFLFELLGRRLPEKRRLEALLGEYRA